MKLALALAALALGCAGAGGREAPIPYVPNRLDYAAFAAAWPDLLEPNYLPFMVHRLPGDPVAGDRLVLCRWPDEAMPLTVFVATAAIPDELQDEFAPRAPEAYREAVRRAFATWEAALDGLVRFRIVEEARAARLGVRLVGRRAPAPEPELQVLGKTRVAGACRVRGSDPDAERLDVAFGVRELEVFLADEFGLLSPDQVEWIALHEIGHALGMAGHSPIPADLMYEVARDRVIVHGGLSEEDVNSFVSLYQLPNGTLYGRVTAAGPPGFEDPGEPALALAPYVDARLGFELRPPARWLRVSTSQGMVAVHGLTWDYAASFQIVVHRYESIDAFLERYADYYRRRGSIGSARRLSLDGRPALQVEIALFESPRIEQMTLIEVGDGRVFAAIGDAPAERIDAYRPWFEAALGSLEITALPRDAWPRRAP